MDSTDNSRKKKEKENMKIDKNDDGFKSQQMEKKKNWKPEIANKNNKIQVTFSPW